MSTWRMDVEEVEEAKDVEELEDDTTASVRSRLARNATNVGMATSGEYTPRRT
jgi:hypothetical protein